MCITCTCTYVHVLTCIMYKKISMLLDRLHDNNCKKHEYCYSCVYLHTRVLCVCSIDIVQCYNINSHCIPLYSPHLALLCVLHTHTHTHTHLTGIQQAKKDLKHSQHSTIEEHRYNKDIIHQSIYTCIHSTCCCTCSLGNNISI